MSQLKKNLSLYGLTMIAIGACIGSGIFLTPNVVAKEIPHFSFILFVWFLGGLISIFGALTFAELGSRFPKSGGVYVYIKEAYGDVFGFLYGWVILLVINTGALAALSVGMTHFIGLFIDIPSGMQAWVSAACILGLTGINILGVKISEWLANLFTGAKLLAIVLIVILALIISPDAETLSSLASQENRLPEKLFSAFFVSLVAVFWSFGGWHHTSYLSSEAINAKRNIPLAMVLGTAIVTSVYIAVNYAYMQALSLSDLAESDRVAGDALEALIPGGGRIVGVLVIVSIIGTIAIYTMSAPRIYYAMANDGLFFKGLSKTHPKFKTPVNAMLIQAVWAVLLIFLWKHFVRLITFVTFMDILFMMLAASSIFVFRRKYEDKAEVRAWGYPIIPAMYIIITAIFVVNTALTLKAESAVGLVIMILGIPVYLYFKKNKTE